MTSRRAVRNAPWLALGVALSCVTGAGIAAQAAGRSSNEPAQIAVVGNEYAFIQFPATITAGKTLFSFENRGKVKHEMAIVLLKPGVTVQQVFQKGPGAATSRELVASLIGILVARVGESSGGQLFVDLRPGQRYLVMCTLKTTPGGPPEGRPHAELGMVTSFDVPLAPELP